MRASSATVPRKALCLITGPFVLYTFVLWNARDRGTVLEGPGVVNQVEDQVAGQMPAYLVVLED